MKTELRLPSGVEGNELYVSCWAPEDKPRAVIQLTHGMAEHIDRYDGFCEYLNENGILAVGFDLPGHGKSVQEGGVLGYFGDDHGWDNLIFDMRTVYRRFKKEYPDVPYILFGHSMGSFLARTYAARYGDDMDAFIFCGTAGKNPLIGIAKLIAKSEMKKKGTRTPSEKLDALAFGSYAKAVKNARTKFDWLTRDAGIVDKYIADDKCGFIFTSSGFAALFDGLTEIAAKEWPARVPKKPILIIAGGADPVGENGKGVRQVADALSDAGHDVTLMVYEGARHEILNETMKENVRADILEFINKVC